MRFLPHRPARPSIVTLAAAAVLLVGSAIAGAQAQTPKPNWHNLDLQTDSVFGVSTERAYKELLAGTKATPVLVAVIDGGIDQKHEDLRSIMWVNPKEKAGNKRDNDGNGYANDVFGWNFIGGPNGNVWYDNLEITRILRGLRGKYGPVYASGDASRLSASERDTLKLYTELVEDYRRQLQEAVGPLTNISRILTVVDTIASRTGKPNPTLADFQSYEARNGVENQVLGIIKNALSRDTSVTFAKFRKEQLADGQSHFQEIVNYYLNFAFDPRSVVGDDTTNGAERSYGNADVRGPDADHGTHVAGIIAAVRDNNIGVKGVADAVRVIAVRAVPTGDERDKDVANAIRYAVDAGARVINMSFGKPYSPGKPLVDAAVKYAMSKDVLLVHAAGNDGRNLDAGPQYPSRVYGDGSGTADAWIEVGASAWNDDESLVTPFSNYGKTTVDLFAPGARINSTFPDSKYEPLDGTSMAAPVVSGVAALIRSRYPALTAVQVKDILMRSVTKVEHSVTVVDAGMRQNVPFTSVCISGGVVNAYNALKLAAEVSAGASK
jgi:subtilisin family serine protease